MSTTKPTVHLLDYGAGNVRSVRNAILAAGYPLVEITSPDEILEASCLIFPGVGSFGNAMDVLQSKGYVEPLRQYLRENRPYLGICLGMQTLFESSEESPSHAGLGVLPGKVVKFLKSEVGTVPHIGWNGRIVHKNSPVFSEMVPTEEVYFVHSYYAPIPDPGSANHDFVLSSTMYRGKRFVSAVQRGNLVATQFHPEKSGAGGINLLRGFLSAVEAGTLSSSTSPILNLKVSEEKTELVKRIVVALDVRSNDDGDLVVTKGDQYDVREKNPATDSGGAGGESDDEDGGGTKRKVRNLGKPVSLASRYYREGADEIAFLNITSFRQGVLEDMPMLAVLEAASRECFVPLTVGGGIREYKDDVSGTTYTALEVAGRYFRAGADKVSIGSDAVLASESLLASPVKTGTTSIEQISNVYGVQAVVVSIDPKRVYLASPDPSSPHHIIHLPPKDKGGPNGERHVWYQCTIKGGREYRNICAVTVAKCVETLGAGEIMLNCIDSDGQCHGFDLPLMRAVKEAVSIPVIASSGAGCPEHFQEVFEETGVEAALAAGMFHRKEVEIEDVKKCLLKHGTPARV